MKELYTIRNVLSKGAVSRRVLVIRPFWKKGPFHARKNTLRSPRQEGRLSPLGSGCGPSPPKVVTLNQLGAIRVP